MTVIASDGIHIVADGMKILGQSEIAELNVRKIKVRENTIFAVTGAAALLDVLAEWYLAGCNPKATPVIGGDVTWTLIVIATSGGPLKFSHTLPYPERWSYPMSAGIGADYAMAAMLAGASARRAVEIACAKDAFCGGEIQVVNIAEVLGLGGPNHPSRSRLAAATLPQRLVHPA